MDEQPAWLPGCVSFSFSLFVCEMRILLTDLGGSLQFRAAMIFNGTAASVPKQPCNVVFYLLHLLESYHDGQPYSENENNTRKLCYSRLNIILF